MRLPDPPHGPPAGATRLLTAEQEADIRLLIRRHPPDALGLPFALWSRPAVRMLIEQRCGVALAVRTNGKYLKSLCFGMQI